MARGRSGSGFQPLSDGGGSRLLLNQQPGPVIATNGGGSSGGGEMKSRHHALLLGRFEAFDEDGSGCIGRHELPRILQYFGYEVTPQICGKIMASFDDDNSQVIGHARINM